MASTPSEPHVPLRGTVAGCCDNREDPWEPRGQGPGSAVIPGNLGQGQSGSGDLGIRPSPSWVTFSCLFGPALSNVLQTLQNGLCSTPGSYPYLPDPCHDCHRAFCPLAGHLGRLPPQQTQPTSSQDALPRSEKAKDAQRGWWTRAYGRPTVGGLGGAGAAWGKV